MADVKGLLSDPEFQKLDPATQKSTLGRLDPEFSSLTDEQFNQFKSKIVPKSNVPGWMTDKLPKKKDVPPVFDSNRTGGGEKGYVDPFEAYGTALAVMGGGELAVSGARAIASGAAKSFLKATLPKLITGAVAGGAAKGVSDKLGLPSVVGDVAGIGAAGLAGYGEGKVGEFLRSIPKDVVKNPNPLAFFQWLAEKSKTSEVAADLLAQKNIGPPNVSGGKIDTNKVASGRFASPATPKPNPGAGPANVSSGNPIPESVAAGEFPPPPRPKVNPGAGPANVGSSSGPGEFPPSPAKKTNPGLGPPSVGTAESMPRSPITPAPTATVDASKVADAIETAKAMGGDLSKLKDAPQATWDGIGRQLKVKVDDAFKKAVIDRIESETPGATRKPSPASGVQEAAPKTPRPSPGGAKVKSTVTPEARAARAEEHATKIAARLKKDGVRELPSITDDAAWKLIEQQTGTEASPKVRAAAIEKARALWKADQGDLQSRREAYFSQPPEK